MEKKRKMAGDVDSSLAGFTLTEQHIIQKLEHYMQMKGYLDPEISLIGLAAKLGTNRTYLSDIVHEHYGMTFSDYINSKRIADAKKALIESQGEVLIRDLHKELGYNSATSFFRNFKRQTGKSTGEWVKEMIDNGTIVVK